MDAITPRVAHSRAKLVSPGSQAGTSPATELAAGFGAGVGGGGGVTSYAPGVMDIRTATPTNVPTAAAAKPIPIRLVGRHGNVPSANTAGMIQEIDQKK